MARGLAHTALVVRILDVGTVGSGVEEVDADLAVHVVVIDGLLAVGLAVKGGGVPGALELDQQGPAHPGPAAAHGSFHLGRVFLGLGLHVHVLAAAHAVNVVGAAGLKVLHLEGGAAGGQLVGLAPFDELAVLGNGAIGLCGGLGLGGRRGRGDAAVVQRAGGAIGVKQGSCLSAHDAILGELVVLLKVHDSLLGHGTEGSCDLVVVVSQILQAQLQGDDPVALVARLEQEVPIQVGNRRGGGGGQGGRRGGEAGAGLAGGALFGLLGGACIARVSL